MSRALDGGVQCFGFLLVGVVWWLFKLCNVGEYGDAEGVVGPRGVLETTVGAAPVVTALEHFLRGFNPRGVVLAWPELKAQVSAVCGELCPFPFWMPVEEAWGPGVQWFGGKWYDDCLAG